MAYYMEITSSQAWTCPKTGDYKITCVAGGGGLENDNLISGGSTSFGTYMTCSGYIATTLPKTLESIGITGYIPTHPEAYGSSVPDGPGTSVGYGAAGISLNKTGNSTIRAYSYCGKLERKIVHLEKGTTIACTIGEGAPATGTATTSPYTYGANGFISIQEV